MTRKQKPPPQIIDAAPKEAEPREGDLIDAVRDLFASVERVRRELRALAPRRRGPPPTR